jgi:beta-glucosidase
MLPKLHSRTILLVILNTIPFLLFSQKTNPAIERKIDVLLAKMTIEEKAGEMTQLALDMVCDGDPYNLKQPLTINKEKLKKVLQEYHVGSILNVGTTAHTAARWQEIITEIQTEAGKSRLKIPVLYGIDAIHGVNYTLGTTLYPQPLAVAATWNPGLAEQLGNITGYECRASGIPWTFSPAMDLCRFPVWSRTWESFGEDVLMNKIFGSAMVKGYQGTDMSNPFRIAACMKHFTGYGAAVSGKDRTYAWIPDRELREYFLPQYEEAIKNGAMTVMINSSGFNGIPAHANKQLLTGILKEEWGFKGFTVSDWEDVKYLTTRHKIAENYKEAVKIAVNAGIDMTMVPNDLEFTTLLIELIKEKAIPMTRINDAVRRILRVKMMLGLFEKTHDPLSSFPKFGGEEFRQTALEAARQSLVLAKNTNNALPLSKTSKVLVVGPTAGSIRALNGGWTNSWQGEKSNEVYKEKNTILESIVKKIGTDKVTYFEGANFERLTTIDDAVRAASSGDYASIVLCLGEESYTEVPGTINDLALDAYQVELANALAKTGKPIVLVLAEGRPRLINSIEANMKAVLIALYPGMEGGEAIADVLFGDVNPSGKLPLTYPRYANGIVPYDYKFLESLDASTGYPDGKNKFYDPQYEFGSGMSYTKFEYKNLVINKKEFDKNENIQISVQVTNTGGREGKEVVQLYVSDLFASIAPSVKRLRGFQKVNLKAGETQTVTFNISFRDLAFVGINNKWVTEPGAFKALVGGLTADFELKKPVKAAAVKKYP